MASALLRTHTVRPYLTIMKNLLPKIIERLLSKFSKFPRQLLGKKNAPNGFLINLRKNNSKKFLPIPKGTCAQDCAGIRRQNRRHPLIISAHTDTVFPLDTDLGIRRDPRAHLRPRHRRQFARGGRLVWSDLGNSGEGNLRWTAISGSWQILLKKVMGDLKGMRAVVDRFGDTPVAYLVLEGMALGQIYHRALGVRQLQNQCTHTGRALVGALRTPICDSRAHPPGQPPARYSNPRAPDIIYECRHHRRRHIDQHNRTLRRAPTGLAFRRTGHTSKINRASRNDCKIPRARRRSSFELEGVRIEIEIIGDRPAGELPPDHSLVKLAMRNLDDVGIAAKLNIGSTDANIPISRGLPAICVGLTKGGGAHTLEEFIETAPLEKGLRQVLGVIDGVWG